jgi:[ribosomal protein S5]-alanine N-acetyltransferase
MSSSLLSDSCMSNFPNIETERLLLREIVAADAPELFAIHSDEAAMRWFGSEPLTTVQQATKLIETFADWRQLPNPGVRWGVQCKADQRLIGSCGLFKWNRQWKSCVIGFELASFAWGKGLMNEALSASLEWGFNYMELNRVEAQVHPENAASIRLLAKLGFVQEGCLREAGFWLGKHHDLQQFALLRRQYTATRSSVRSFVAD